MNKLSNEITTGKSIPNDSLRIPDLFNLKGIIKTSK